MIDEVTANIAFQLTELYEKIAPIGNKDEIFDNFQFFYEKLNVLGGNYISINKIKKQILILENANAYTMEETKIKEGCIKLLKNFIEEV